NYVENNILKKHIQIESQDYFEFLQKHDFEFHNLEIPNFIMTCSSNLLRIFLQNYFEINAQVDFNKKIQITKNSRKLIYQLYHLLKLFGISSSIKKNENKQKYDINISGKNLILFQNEIG